MNVLKSLGLAVALTLPLMSAGVMAAPTGGKLLYRYVDDKGKTVLNDQLPPEAVKRGYDIIRRDGTLVETVAGAPTKAEMEEVQRARLREEEAERLREWDESLLLRYSNVDDIEAAKGRALDEIRVRIAILNSNLHSLKRQVESEQEQAANIERQDGEVPQERVDIIRRLKWHIADVEEMLSRREQELQEVTASYDHDINRFETLIERIGKRR